MDIFKRYIFLCGNGIFLRKPEQMVNEQIGNAVPVVTEVMSLEEAKKSGAMALFDEKYGDSVRVVTMGPSKELCAGTHVANTADIKHFAIASVESIGSGIYRVLAYTGEGYMESV